MNIDVQPASPTRSPTSERQLRSSSRSPKKASSPKKTTSPKKSPTKAGSKSPKKSTFTEVKGDGSPSKRLARRMDQLNKISEEKARDLRPPSVQRNNSRSLSLTGRSVVDDEDETMCQVQPDDPCLPSGTRSFAKTRSVGSRSSTTEGKTDTESAAFHFENTFSKSLLIFQERFGQLQNAYRTRMKLDFQTSETEIKHFRALVVHLSNAAIQLSTVAKAFDRKSKIAKEGFEPDDAAEGISQSKLIASKLTSYFDTIVRNIRLSRSKDIPLDITIEGWRLNEADDSIGEAVEDLSNILRFINPRK